MLVLESTKDLNVEQLPESESGMKLFIIKLVADERKSGKDSTTVDLSREEIVSFNVTAKKVRSQ